jgi:hypothetical protein
MSNHDVGYTAVAPELVVGAWRGYRVWRMSGDRLIGWWHTAYTWQPGGSEAACTARRWNLFRGSSSRHPALPAPQRDCRCGIYALHDPWDFNGELPAHVFGYSDVSNVVTGVVAGWGRAFRGEYGWRAQFAKPVALYRAQVLDPRVDRIAARYGCPVVDQPGDLIAFARQRA